MVHGSDDDAVVAVATYKTYRSMLSLIAPLAAIAIVGLTAQLLFAWMWPVFIPLALLSWVWLFLIFRHRRRAPDAPADPGWLVWIATWPLRDAIWAAVILTGLVWQFAPSDKMPAPPATQQTPEKH